MRTRSVHCIDGEAGNQEEERNCDINFKPNPTSECNTQTCLEWVNSDWGRVSDFVLTIIDGETGDQGKLREKL